MNTPGWEILNKLDMTAKAAPSGSPARLARLHPDCPARPLAWRWQPAGLLRELGLRWSRRRDDGPTREAKFFQSALRRCRDDAGRIRLADRMPGIAGACAIRDGEPRVRWAVEARLLAGEPIDDVASKIGLMPEGVAWFERLFFNVSDRLWNRGYIVHVAIGPRLHRGPRAWDLDVLWKVFGVFGGPIALDALIGATWDASSERNRSTEVLPEADFLPGILGLALAAMTLPGELPGRSGSTALLRLAASERRYAESNRGNATLLPCLLPLSEQLQELVAMGSEAAFSRISVSEREECRASQMPSAYPPVPGSRSTRAADRQRKLGCRRDEAASSMIIGSSHRAALARRSSRDGVRRERLLLPVGT